MPEYGMIYDKSDVKRGLYDSNRDYYQRKTWDAMFADVDYQSQAAKEYNTEDFSNIVNNAYAASIAGSNAISNSNLGSGYKSKLMLDNSSLLRNAYQSSLQNYRESNSKIDEATMSKRMSISEMADKQASNIVDYTNAHFDYLEHLYNEYREGNNKIFDNPNYAKYLIKDGEEMRLKSKQELLRPEQDSNGDWLSLYDSDSNITSRGIDFFDMLENDISEGQSFGQYLAENNKELFDWSQKDDTFNYTLSGKNKGSVKNMLGLSSIDDEYTFLERFGGMTKSESENLFASFTDKSNQIAEAAKKSKDHPEEVARLSTELFEEVQDLFADLGISDSVLKENGINLSKYKTILFGDGINGNNGLVGSVKSQGEMTEDFFNEWLVQAEALLLGAGAADAGRRLFTAKQGVASGAKLLNGAKGVATASKANPVFFVAEVVASLAAVIGLGSIAGGYKVDLTRKQNEVYGNAMSNVSKNLVEGIVASANMMRENSQKHVDDNRF